MKAKSAIFLFSLLAFLLPLFSATVDGHEIGISEVDVSFSPEGDFRIEIPIDPAQLLQRVEVSEGVALTLDPTEQQLLAGIERGLPKMRERIEVVFDGQKVDSAIEYLPGEKDENGFHGSLLLEGQVPPGAKEFQFLYRLVFARYALKVQGEAGGEPRVMWLEGAERSPPVSVVLPPPPTLGQVVKDYVYLGFTHILPKGLDHILFVLGLFLLSAHWRPLLWQVTAFTAAHTITLGLATFGVVSLPASIVEPLIALSIVYVAIENVISDKLGRFRVALVFAFGLLHGLGFAGVLHELGLPKSQVFPALLSFNVGVELGQLTVIALAYLLVASWARKKGWYHRRVVVPGSLLIAAIGAYWTIERVWGAFG